MNDWTSGMNSAGSGGPPTKQEPFSRTRESKNNASTELQQFHVGRFEELRSAFYPCLLLPIPDFNWHWRGHRSQFVSPNALGAPSTGSGEIRINGELIWRDQAKFLQVMSEAIVDLELYHCRGELYTDGYHSNSFLHALKKLGLAESKPGQTGKETREDYLLEIVSNGPADITFRKIIASGVFARLYAMVPDPRNRPEPVSRKTGKSRREIQNASQTSWVCPELGGSHARVRGRKNSDVICGPCYRQTAIIRFLIKDVDSQGSSA